ncbi:hypothetical protein CYY_000327 [Polysphondylium violaceum]|uniref:3'-5' exonuclease domain-containing protein n=1 Tax=Polysphondylium violaceum TaxID=133409 RepID=A0A8J4V5P2_9MYCE|nr:hypothetical protein CYY_000327 [Polysphondylium violaceum]
MSKRKKDQVDKEEEEDQVKENNVALEKKDKKRNIKLKIKKEKKEKKEKKDKKENKDKKDQKEDKIKDKKQDKKQDKKDKVKDEKQDIQVEKKTLEIDSQQESEEKQESEKKEIEEKIEEILNFNDQEHLDNIDFQERPWLKLIKGQFQNILWSSDKEIPHIIVIFTVEECNKFIGLLPDIFSQELGAKVSKKRMVLGFDTEGKNPFSLQLSTKTVTAVIYIKFFESLGGPLTDLLQDKAIVKAGVAVTDDFEKLTLAHPKCKPRGALDVACVANFNGLTQNYLSLDVLAIDLLNTQKYKRVHYEEFLQIPKQKEEWVQFQIKRMTSHKYAAIDAWLGYKLAEVLYQHLKNDISFYDWSFGQQTGNFRFKVKGGRGDQETKDIPKNTATTTPRNNDEFKKKQDSNHHKNNSNNTDDAIVQKKKEISEQRYKVAEDHTYLNKLQQIKQGQRRPFI